MTSTGDVQTVAGTGKAGDSGDGRAAVGAELDDPSALALTADGSLYVATGGRIRRIDPQGLIRPVTCFPVVSVIVTAEYWSGIVLLGSTIASNRS